MVRKRLGFGDEKIILFSSRLVKPYQIIEAIQVLSKFKKKNFLAIFTSYGEKAYVREIEEKIKNTGMSSRIILTGYISNEEMRDYYSACDVFMMTSIVNAGPASTYKAIMMNKPVITTDSGRASEILKENQAGYIIPTQNLKKWEEAIDYFLSGNKIPVLNGETVPEFNWEYSLKKWHELFRRAIQKNTSV
jgi:glycosyltransferase involved in cell wall biosynthesis